MFETQSGSRRPAPRRAALAGVLLAWSAVALAETAPLKTLRSFDIPAQPLQTAILAFADQARIQVLLWAGPTSNAPSSGATGMLRTIDALKAILANTGLSYRQIDAETVAIVNGPR